MFFTQMGIFPMIYRNMSIDIKKETLILIILQSKLKQMLHPLFCFFLGRNVTQAYP